MSGISLSVETRNAPDGLEDRLNGILGYCADVENVGSVACGVRIVDNALIREINAEFRNVDSATDVLSFPSVNYPKGKTAKDCPKLLRREFDPEQRAAFIGDVVISLERAEEQAGMFGHSLTRELCYLMAHSVFHLFGYDHMNQDDKSIMREREERVMRLAGLPRKDDYD